MPRSGDVFSLPAGTTATTNTAIESAKYNAFLADLVSDLNAARPIVAGGTGATTASGARTALGLAIGTNVQAYDATLASLSGLPLAAGKGLYATAADTLALYDLTAYGRSIGGVANEAAFKALVNLEIGTDVQAYGATLTSLEGLSLAQGDVLYATAADTLARLPKGTAGQVLQMNGGATAPEWATQTPVTGWQPVGGAPLWDFAVSGATASPIETANFEDGWEYCLYGEDISGSAATANFTIGLYRETTAAYTDLGTLFSSSGAAQTANFMLELSFPRTTSFLHTGRWWAANSGATNGVSISAGWASWQMTHATAQKLLKARFVLSAGTFDAGKIWVLRRVASFS